MTWVYCFYCKEGFKSEAKLYVHLAIQHEAQASQDVKEQSIKSLERIKDQVHYLLIKFPQTRSSDKLLFEKILQYFSPFLIYDAETKLIKPRNQGWTFEDFLHFPNYETMRRSRQLLQSRYEELRASQKVEEQRESKEDAYRQYFTQVKQ